MEEGADIRTEKTLVRTNGVRERIRARREREKDMSVAGLLRRQLSATRAVLAVCAVTFLLILTAVLLVVPGALRTLNDANQLIRDTDELIAQLDGVDTAVASLTNLAAELENADLPGMLENIGELVGASQEAIAETRKKVDSMDIDTLNQAIHDLSAVVSPLAKLFGGGK